LEGGGGGGGTPIYHYDLFIYLEVEIVCSFGVAMDGHPCKPPFYILPSCVEDDDGLDD